jgi:hypothetical protein
LIFLRGEKKKDLGFVTQQPCVEIVMLCVIAAHTRAYKALKQRVTRLKPLSGRVSRGKVVPGAVRGLKIDLRQVLAGNIMINSTLGEILQQGRVLQWPL